MKKRKVNIKERLLQRINIDDIFEIVYVVQSDDKQKQELFSLLFDENDKVAYQAAWVFTHFTLHENKWLYDKQHELTDEVLVCLHPGKRRMLLSLLYRQPLLNPPRVDFLDFCLEHMMAKEELPGVQMLCMKLAYEMCRLVPELRQELRATLEIMEPDMLVVSVRTVRKNVLKAMKIGKSLQIY